MPALRGRGALLEPVEEEVDALMLLLPPLPMVLKGTGTVLPSPPDVSMVFMLLLDDIVMDIMEEVLDICDQQLAL